MPRRNMDRKMISFYISRSAEQSVHDLAVKLGQTYADTYRQLLSIGLQHAPTKPAKSAAGTEAV